MYTIQNMDEEAKCDANTLTAHYDGFDIIYHLNQSNTVMTMTIENKSNKSLIIDKAKCYVLYDGYSHELFKDVRTGKVTTYNNVQDAISNVQTNESSVTLSVPPYSKWDLPIEETNLKAAKDPRNSFDMIWEEGEHPISNFKTNEVTEFIIPYTYDYALAKWSTARNRVFIGNIRVLKDNLYGDPNTKISDVLTEDNQTIFCKAEVNPNEDLTAYNAVEDYNVKAIQYNRKIYHRRGGILTVTGAALH